MNHFEKTLTQCRFNMFSKARNYKYCVAFYTIQTAIFNFPV